ncbi:PLP-dependent aminotransferase family protein [Neptunomonas antarctica]|uniref:Transcriptional regulator, GntR family n=1 Tax=Neptunomonas antarctica TaxID=619304 RepID=A0A1N7N3L7_9GAMM|nr:PLP-dependent aminotransferase family protein [Neptunomonas antarctica]SIS92935.1 transcriptional regulator, GntR family [Neptunomonas antarctica]
MKIRESLAQKITNNFIQQIESGQLTTGTRLPSIRNTAESFGVSKNTISDAYDRLVAIGYIRPRRGSGFYVEAAQPSLPTIKPEHFTEAVDLVSLLREQLNQHYEVRAGDGRLPASWMESTDFLKYFKSSYSKKEQQDEFEYGQPQGLLSLREDIARTMIDRAITVHPDQILMTFGANHALDLIIRHFVNAGESVIVEIPGYYPLFGKLRLQRANIIGVKRTIHGLDLAELEQKVRQHRPRLLFVQPMAHNPTGTSMSLQNMHGLLRIAEKYELTVIEDDPFGDILPRSTPHLASLDALNRVIYIGTFSKTLSASLRCGYIAANEAVIRSLTDIKMLTVVNSSSIIERMIHEMIVRGRYRRHMTRLRDKVAKTSAEAVSALRQIGLDCLQPSTGGYYIWCTLPDHVDGKILASKASTQGIFLAPSHLFSLPDNEVESALRINIAHAKHPRLLQFLGDEIAEKNKQ